MHRASGRDGRAVVPDAAEDAAEQARGDDRRPEPRRHSSLAACVGDAQRGAVRLLPDGADHAGGLAAHADPQSHGCRHRSCDAGQHLPLRHVSAHSRGHQDGVEREAVMNAIVNVSRRQFLGGLVSTGAFVLAARVLPESAWAQTPIGGFKTKADTAALNPSVYLGIEPDGTVFIVTHRSEMGTGIRTSLPLVAADELDADWSKCRIEQGVGDTRYGDQNTDGSRSIRDFYDAFRIAGASARAMLITAAAAQLKVPASELTTANHSVVHARSGQKVGYGALVPAAAKL